MPYISTQWVNGDIISAEKLNNIENALVNTFLVKCIWDEENQSSYCDCTYSDLDSALASGKHIIIKDFFYDGDPNAIYYTNIQMSAPFTDYTMYPYVYNFELDGTNTHIKERSNASLFEDNVKYTGGIYIDLKGYIITPNGLQSANKSISMTWHQNDPSDTDPSHRSFSFESAGFRDGGFNWSPVPYSING